MKKKKHHPLKIALLLFLFFITFSLCYFFKDTALWYLAHANITFLEGTLISRPFGTLPYKVIGRDIGWGKLGDSEVIIIGSQIELDQLVSKLGNYYNVALVEKIRTIDFDKYVVAGIFTSTGFGDPLFIQSITISGNTIKIYQQGIRPLWKDYVSLPTMIGSGSVVILLERKYLPSSITNWELYTTVRVPSEKKTERQMLLDSVEYAPMR